MGAAVHQLGEIVMEPLPLDPLGRWLCQTFPYRWHAIEGTPGPKPQWKTNTKFPLRPRALWLKWQDAATLIGVRFGRETAYGLIDIDAGSPYLRDIPQLLAALETIGIVRTVIVRSSWSGGLHIYCPLPRAVGTFDLAVALRQCMESQGVVVQNGQLELFPNVKSFGAAWIGQFTEYNGHRLPLQPGSGSCLLDQALNPIGGDLQRFAWAWQQAAAGQDMQQLHQALTAGRANRRRRRGSKQNRPAEEWRDDLGCEIAEGWTDHGQTNHLLKSIATYGRVFEGLSGDELVLYTHQVAINAPGFTRWCRHQADIRMRSRIWARAVEKYYYPLGSEPQRSGTGQPENINQARSEDAQSRIRVVVAQLQAMGEVCDRASEFADRIVTLARVSLKTLYKHLHLWHPEHRCKNNDVAGVSEDFSTEEEDPPEMSETLDISYVFTPAPPNEGCRSDAPPQKFLLRQGREGGAGERGGISTGQGGSDGC